jgi:hypothetical protein
MRMRRRKQQRQKKEREKTGSVKLRGKQRGRCKCKVRKMCDDSYPFFIVLIVELNGYKTVFGGSRAAAARRGGTGDICRHG